jgi:hypothetical protein
VKNLLLMGALATLAALTSCATYRLQPVSPSGSALVAAASHSQAEVTADGVTVEAVAEWAPEIQFDVRIVNKGTVPLTVNSDLFQLYTGTPGHWDPLAMIQSVDYYRRAERYTPDQVLVVQNEPVYRQTTIVGGGVSSVTVIRTQPVPVTRSTVYVDNTAQERLARLKDSLFYTQTVAPGENKGGLVFGFRGKGQYYKLVVPINGKDYELYFEKVKEKTSPFTNVDF